MFRYPVTETKNLILRDFLNIGWYQLVPLEDAVTILSSTPYRYGYHISGYYLHKGQLFPLPDGTLRYEILMPRSPVSQPVEQKSGEKHLDQLLFDW